MSTPTWPAMILGENRQLHLVFVSISTRIGLVDDLLWSQASWHIVYLVAAPATSTTRDQSPGLRTLAEICRF